MINEKHSTTIAALATPVGKGGVGVVRVSGPLVLDLCEKILGRLPKKRHAITTAFFAANKEVIDKGIAIYFAAPNSFTGEDVLELHCHGGPVVMDLLLQRVLAAGAQLARPGEFTERAFLNQKIDLIQAEATADLINAVTAKAAKNAVRSLQGDFSSQVNTIIRAIEEARALLEASIDFAEDVADSLVGDEIFLEKVKAIWDLLKETKITAQQGAVFQNGFVVVITGRPNVGKSSLFNWLSNQDRAIVTDIPGTTRDVLYAHIQLDDLPIHLFDTAGLREQVDVIEQEGVRRAKEEIKKADHILLVIDAHENQENSHDIKKTINEIISKSEHAVAATVIYNKIDLMAEDAKHVCKDNINYIYLSVKTKTGLGLLKKHLKESAGVASAADGFSARRRHIDALARAEERIQNTLNSSQVLEFMAEELLQAQKALEVITGKVTTENLLDKIFSEFCVGK